MESPNAELVELEMLAISQDMEDGKDVPPQRQLEYLNWREKIVSAQMKDDPVQILAHDSILQQIKAINDAITNSGDRGGGTTGQASVRDTHNNPR